MPFRPIFRSFISASLTGGRLSQRPAARCLSSISLLSSVLSSLQSENVLLTTNPLVFLPPKTLNPSSVLSPILLLKSHFTQTLIIPPIIPSPTKMLSSCPRVEQARAQSHTLKFHKSSPITNTAFDQPTAVALSVVVWRRLAQLGHIHTDAAPKSRARKACNRKTLTQSRNTRNNRGRNQDIYTVPPTTTSTPPPTSSIYR